jgi:hypothetical protein
MEKRLFNLQRERFAFPIKQGFFFPIKQGFFFPIKQGFSPTIARILRTSTIPILLFFEKLIRL